MSEAMDQPAESPGNPKPGEGGDDSMEPGTCQELLHRLRELEVGRGPGGAAVLARALGEMGVGLCVGVDPPLSPLRQAGAELNASLAEALSLLLAL